MNKFRVVRDNPVLHGLIIEKWIASYGSETAVILCSDDKKWGVYYRGDIYQAGGFLSAQIKAMELLDVRTEDRVETPGGASVVSGC